jgi:low temperature requirement protein LtrA
VTHLISRSALPLVFRDRLTEVEFDAAHLPERFGTVLIIALGESIVAIGAPAASGRLQPAVIGAAALAFVAACGLWWLYFQSAYGAIRETLRAADVQTDIVRRILSYSHLSFIAAVICMSVGIREVVAHPGQRLDRATIAMVLGGLAVYVATYAYVRWCLSRDWTRVGLAAIVVLLALVPLASSVSGLGMLITLAMVLLLVNALERALTGPTAPVRRTHDHE